MDTRTLRVYTATQAAETLGITRQRVHQIAQRMKIGTKQGRMILFTDEEVRQMANRPDWRAENSGGGRRKKVE